MAQVIDQPIITPASAHRTPQADPEALRRRALIWASAAEHVTGAAHHDALAVAHAAAALLHRATGAV